MLGLLSVNALAQGEVDEGLLGRGALENPLANFPSKPLPKVNVGGALVVAETGLLG